LTKVATSDEVRLVVPAMPEYLRLVRVTAAGLASRLGFSFDEVEDLRLAIDELCYGLTGSAGRPGTVEVRYLVSADSLVIEGDGHFEDGSRDTSEATLSELSQVILAALVDEHALRSGGDGPHFRLAKRRSPTLAGTYEPGSTSAPS
jgi:serine/threonine-protein kinase RsbW